MSETAASSPAHPRSRGEHLVRNTQNVDARGSSPLARGALLPLALPMMPVRLIPARAGSTRAPARLTRSVTAHPRSRGEHLDRADERDACAGSSPLARGAQQHLGHGFRGGRLIPARAGSTLPDWARGPSAGAHPRSRGEHTIGNVPMIVADGSSPLARGAPAVTQAAPAGPRLIPARAGSTGTRRRTRGAARAHPRSRGEHLDRAAIPARTSGSSPLARGARSTATPVRR